MKQMQEKVQQALLDLLVYGLQKDLLPLRDRFWVYNSLLHHFGLTACSRTVAKAIEALDDREKLALLPTVALEKTLEILLVEAGNLGLIDATSITACDLFDTALMGALTPPPSVVAVKFHDLYKENPVAATNWYYELSQNTNYIRSARIARDRRWKYESPYGYLDITINRSKPEKDPKAIAAAAKQAKEVVGDHSLYPACMLCVANEGYAGHLLHPARQNLRLIQMPMEDGQWYMQFSPYIYYHEHCIFLSAEHHPMKIDRSCFAHLLDITAYLPHYFVGSNADLPIVGGSILAHEHFQGGCYHFAMEEAPVLAKINFPKAVDVEAEWVYWPLSVLRLRSKDRAKIVDLADAILNAWRNYSDEEAAILAYSKGPDGELVPHNTITPVARRRGADFELDLVFRNNRTTAERPHGIFHSREECHHIKRENIGVIEVMGLAVLPARLHEELDALADALLKGADLRVDPLTALHADWGEAVLAEYGENLSAVNIKSVLEHEVGKVFTSVLEDCGVFKHDDVGLAARWRWTKAIGGEEG